MNQIFQYDQDPQVSEELLRFLRTKFPLEGFKNVRGIEQLYRYQGAQDVIDVLHAAAIRQSQG
ncbi:hypothetical protein X733_13760 [Mesorhizobium sp. L2C067A000]|nr:hypothetical protein X733_13760 [Mesorhizobium sp. L2C067A000]